MSWTSATDADTKAMLDTIGVKSIDDLFSTIPDDLRLKSWDVPEGISEMATRAELDRLANKNDVALTSFMGGGFYDHYIPAAVDALSLRSEFYTAYTPYQPECAQGTLQSIYEYQSAICRLTEMEFANASLYEGGTAVFEAATMSLRCTKKRNKIVCHPSMNPTYRSMLDTHMANLDVEIVDGDDPTDAACVIVQNPAFGGTIQDFTALGEACHEAGALLVVSFYPISLGLMKTPGAMGADIAIAEGQSLGIPLAFGGPYLGILATLKKHVRKMPGRICGQTTDTEGRRGFVLTLQAREQHIRRGKAMSNICSNQALCALRALIYMSLLGKEGFKDVATHCHSKSEYLKSKLTFGEIQNNGPTFNEFVIRLPKNANTVSTALSKEGFAAGLVLSEITNAHENDLLIAVTEQRTRAELDAFATVLETASCN
ncbi:MAG: aminomethyl-transferring glycine dehydrogenase subunit GcvPA [Candidatus Hydrogenedentota bacterium]